MSLVGHSLGGPVSIHVALAPRSAGLRESGLEPERDEGRGVLQPGVVLRVAPRPFPEQVLARLTAQHGLNNMSLGT